MLPFLYFCSMQSNQEKLVAHFLEQLNLNNSTVSAETHAKLTAQQSAIVSIEDVIAYINTLGQELNSDENINELIEKIEDETDILIHKLKFITASDRPKVLVLDQIDPLKINESAYLQESIKIAGGIPTIVANEADKIILIDSDQNVFSRVPLLLNDSAIAQSKAIELDQLFIITKPNFATIPGYDYLIELESLAEILQPKYFVYGHEGKDWLQFQLK
ncbi:ABC transporter substrate-binding protein [Sphingobacterium prati]